MGDPYDELLAQMEPITRRAESRNRDYDEYGRPIRSGAGALYAMQVMPATSGDPGYGVKPAQSNTPQEFNRVGRDYLDALTRKYGDPATAWAAYNWGPGHVDRAKAAYGENWLAHAPAGVRSYAQGNAQQLTGTSGGAPSAVSKMDEDPYQSEDTGGPLSQWSKDYGDAQTEARQVALDKAALRKQQYEAGLTALEKQPKYDDTLALAAAFLAPTRVRGFKGFAMNMVPALAQMSQDRTTAEQARAKALLDLQRQYSTGQIDDRDTAVKTKLDLLRAGRPAQSAEYSATPTGVIFNRRTGFPVPSPAHVNALLQNPNAARDFDIKFGPGAAREVLTRYGGK